jgi:hydroxymethylbilane synthase
MQALDLIVCPRSLTPSRLRVGTRNSPLALFQTRLFMRLIALKYPELLSECELAEHAIVTSGDRITDSHLADIGGKGLFAKEIHEALLDNRIDCAVHSLKDLETELPHGIVLACVLAREDARDALILGPTCKPANPEDPWGAIPIGAVIGTASVRRQSQLLYRRPDLRIQLMRGNVRTRLNKVKTGDGADASLLAVAGLRRLGLDGEAALVLDPDIMVPAAGQGIIGITVRATDVSIQDLFASIEDPEARLVATAERALLAALDGSCRTPIGSHARLLDNGDVHLTGLVARPNGRFLLKRSLQVPAADARRLGTELGRSLRADSPVDIFI